MIIEILLATLLLWLAFKVVTTTKIFNTVIYFIVFGLVLALVWADLGAFDLALAEAALGAGITGALLLDTVSFLKSKKSSI